MARLLGAGASGWWCSREAFSAAAILRAGGLHVREGLGVGGKGERNSQSTEIFLVVKILF